MDFPEFFSLSKVNDFIKSSRWRGLAVLSSPVNAAQKLDRVDPATGSLCTDRDVALHVLTKPMKVIQVASQTTFLIAKPGIRYFIHTAELAIRNIAADDNTGIQIRGTIDGSVVNFINLASVPLVAGTYSISAVLDILCDENTAVTVTAFVSNPTFQSYIATYCEVGAK